MLERPESNSAEGKLMALEAKTNFEIAVSHFSQGQYASAKSICDKLYKAHPQNFDIIHLLALINYRLGKLSDSKKLFEKATRMNSRSHIMRSNYGTLLKDMSLYPEALLNFEAATQIKPDYANAFFNMGTVLALLGKFPDAIESFKRASMINPGDPEIFYNLALALDEVGDT
jgi:tetratricopeptide (TPR) repeat protein